MEDVTEILARLVGFPTLTNGPNLDLIAWVQGLLTEAGFTVTRIDAPCGTKAGLLAKFGTGDGGVLYAAHSDVVPVAGQAWSDDPFTLRREGDRLIGRGATDMKGFLACVLAKAQGLRAMPPERPFMLALSWDEEIGCQGIPHMIDHVIPTLGRPALVVVGEPTEMQLCLGHKGKAAYRAQCGGEAGHSALAPRFRNALHLAAEVIVALQEVQSEIAQNGPRDPLYDIPHATLHAGLMQGGTALNIVPAQATVDFEIRHLAEELPGALLAKVVERLPEHVTVAQTNSYPGFEGEVPEGLEALPGPIKVAFGTEAGFFAGLGLPTIVCGPGSMARDGHQPDEGVALEQLAACSAFIAMASRLPQP